MGFRNILGGGLKTILNVATGGLSGTVMEIVDNVVGDQLPPEAKADLQVKIQEETTKREIAANQAAADAGRLLQIVRKRWKVQPRTS